MDRIDEKILEVLVKNAVSYNRLWKLLIDKGMHKSHKQAIEKSSYIY